MESSKPEMPQPPVYEDLARLLEHSLLRTELTESDVAQGVAMAKSYGVAAVVVRPCDVDLAVNWVKDSAIALATVVDWPGGHSTTSVKTYAVGDMLRRGAREIGTVMNTGKLRSRQFQYLEMELVQMADACHRAGGVLKVALENEHLDQELKIVACRICRRAGADYLSSTLAADTALLKEYSKERLLLRAPARSLEEAAALRESGYTRIESAHTFAILDAWKAQILAQESPQTEASTQAS